MNGLDDILVDAPKKRWRKPLVLVVIVMLIVGIVLVISGPVLEYLIPPIGPGGVAYGLENTYDYASHQPPNQAWYAPGGQPGPEPYHQPSGVVQYLTELTSTQYTQVSTSNNVRWSYTDAPDPDYYCAYFKFNISENVDTIDNFTVLWEGYGDSGVDWTYCTIYVYSNSYSSWWYQQEGGNWAGIGGPDLELGGTPSAAEMEQFKFIADNGELWIAVTTLGDAAGTCPVVYPYGENGYSDGIEASPAGGLAFPNSLGFQQADPQDWIPVELTPAKDGTFKILVREDQREISYIDATKLYGVTVPEGHDIYSAGAVKWHNGGTGETIHTVADPRPPVSATLNGADVLKHLEFPDDDWTPYGRENRDDVLELNLGDLSGAKQIKLLVKSRTEWINAPGVGIFPPYVEIWNGLTWQRVIVREDSWFDATNYNDRTFCIDITDWFSGVRTRDYRIRIHDWQKKTYDYIAVDTSLDDFTLTEIPLQSASLDHTNYIYHRVSNDRAVWDYGNEWPTNDNYLATKHAGDFTKVGDVAPLLTAVDDQYVVMWVGDEIELSFTAPKQAFDSYVLMTDAYYKMDWTKCFFGENVNLTTPLPFHAMSNYPYDEKVETYPTDAEHLDYLSNWLTREVEPVAVVTHQSLNTDYVKVTVNSTPPPPPPPPAVENIHITDMDNVATSDLATQTQYKFHVELTDNDTLADVENVKLMLYLDNENLPDAPENHYTFLWTKTGGFEETADPNFGYENVGSGTDGVQHDIQGSHFTAPDDGTVDNITVYLGYTVVGGNTKCALYLWSDNSLIDSTEEKNITSAGWHTFSFDTPPSVTADTEYWLCAWSGGTSIVMKYDSGDADVGFAQDLSYDGWPSNLGGTLNDGLYSIYCSYMTAGAHLVPENCENFDNSLTADNIVFTLKFGSTATPTANDNWDAWVQVYDNAGASDNRFFLNIFDIAEAEQWSLIETWTGTVQAPAAWQLIESWEGTVNAPADWSVVESWVGSVSAPAEWGSIETWAGTVSAPAYWGAVETWTGTIEAPAYWTQTEAWGGTITAPAYWNTTETWSGTVNAPGYWATSEAWTSTISAPAEWELIETWTGKVSAPAAWSEVEAWTGTVNAFVAWELIDVWAGTVTAPTYWGLVETWTGTIQTPEIAAWRLCETWVGTVLTEALPVEVTPTTLTPYGLGVAILVPFFILVGSIYIAFKKRVM